MLCLVPVSLHDAVPYAQAHNLVITVMQSLWQRALCQFCATRGRSGLPPALHSHPADAEDIIPVTHITRFSEMFHRVLFSFLIVTGIAFSRTQALDCQLIIGFILICVEY